MTGWICPKCFSTVEPRWEWVKIQGEECYHEPTCPECGATMVESDVCPLCGEMMPEGKELCFDCWNELKAAIEDAVDRVAVKGTSRLVKYDAIAYVANEMIYRLEREEEAKRKEAARCRKK